jgi:hypothetical protein
MLRLTLFLRLHALVYLAAFLSLAVQITGLVGSRGLLPAARFLEETRREMGAHGYWAFPTLAWLNPSDGFLQFLCWGGAVVALAALVVRRPAMLFAPLWFLWLSLVVVGQDFLSFQWDILLLESGFLAMFLPLRPQVVAWLYRALLFRLMFSSGVVKLTSGDQTWRDLTALQYHYETQPIPNAVAWFVHQVPAWVQTVSCAVMFAVELAVPFLIFGPPRVRRASGVVLIALQALIAATGNYAFFNLLAALLCVPLFYDVPAAEPEPGWKRAASLALAGWILAAGLVQLTSLFTQPPAGALLVWGPLSRWNIVNSYGLFAVMTTSRPEIVVQGSLDGEIWRDYEFRYKPGDLKRRPPFVAPHQPRLDWQMWFAALGEHRQNLWFTNLMVRLLEGSPEVQALLGKNPFPDRPPRYVRAVRHDYRFTDWGVLRREGGWWRREYTGLYFPPASLRGE